MSTVPWFDGPPPHVGWWNASTEKWAYARIWRWWNGAAWSRPAVASTPAQHAGICALRIEQEPHQSAMRWTLYWPEYGTVRRVHPETGQTTGNILTPGMRKLMR